MQLVALLSQETWKNRVTKRIKLLDIWVASVILLQNKIINLCFGILTVSKFIV